MAFVRNVDFASVLSNPVAVSALLTATLRKALEADGAGEFASEILSVSEKGGKISVRTTGPLVASALRLRQGKIETALVSALAKFGYRGTVSVHFR